MCARLLDGHVVERVGQLRVVGQLGAEREPELREDALEECRLGAADRYLSNG